MNVKEEMEKQGTRQGTSKYCLLFCQYSAIIFLPALDKHLKEEKRLFKDISKLELPIELDQG